MRKIFSVSRTDKKDDGSLVTLSAMKRTTYYITNIYTLKRSSRIPFK